jgi:hypothetical protein
MRGRLTGGRLIASTGEAADDFGRASRMIEGSSLRLPLARSLIPWMLVAARSTSAGEAPRAVASGFVAGR